MIKAVFFDFDDTLGNREIYAYQCYRDILRQHCSITDPIEFEAVLQHVLIWDQHGDVNKAYVAEMLEKTYDISIGTDDFNTYWDSVLYNYAVPFDGAEKTLAYLKEKYILGVITNGPSHGQRGKLEKSGLSGYFDEDLVIVSGDYDFKKPDPRLFQIACDKAGVKPEEAVFVGDIFARDILGAYRAGMKPIWIWKEGRCCDADVTIIHKIEELEELL